MKLIPEAQEAWGTWLSSWEMQRKMIWERQAETSLWRAGWEAHRPLEGVVPGQLQSSSRLLLVWEHVCFHVRLFLI